MQEKGFAEPFDPRRRLMTSLSFAYGISTAGFLVFESIFVTLYIVFGMCFVLYARWHPKLRSDRMPYWALFHLRALFWPLAALMIILGLARRCSTLPSEMFALAYCDEHASESLDEEARFRRFLRQKQAAMQGGSGEA